MGPSYHTFPGLGTAAAPPFFQTAAAYDGDRRKGRDKEDAVPYPVRVGRKPSLMKDQQGKEAGQQRDGHEGQPHDVQPVDGKGGPFRRQQPADPVRGRATVWIARAPHTAAIVWRAYQTPKAQHRPTAISAVDDT